MKKIMALLVIIFILLLFCGCGKTEDRVSEGTEELWVEGLPAGFPDTIPIHGQAGNIFSTKDTTNGAVTYYVNMEFDGEIGQISDWYEDELKKNWQIDSISSDDYDDFAAFYAEAQDNEYYLSVYLYQEAGSSLVTINIDAEEKIEVAETLDELETERTPIDCSNVAFLGTNDGLNIVDQNGISILNEDHHFIEDILADNQGQIWMADSSGLFVFNGQYWNANDIPEVYSPDVIAIDSTGRIWIGYRGGVSVLDEGEWLSYSSDDFGLGEYADSVNDIAIDHQGQLWVATSSGVAVFDGNSWASYDEASGLVDDSIKAIVVDLEGNIWIANNDGVEVFDGSSWTEVKEVSLVQTLAVDDQGNIWVGARLDGISCFDGSNWKTYESQDYFGGGSVNSISCDSQGRIWLGTDFGLVVFDGQNWFHYTKNTSDLLSNDIGVIAVTGSGPASLPQPLALKTGAAVGNTSPGALVVVCENASMFYSGESPIEGDSYSTTAGNNGDFIITGIPPNRYDVAIKTKEGEWYIMWGSTRILEGETTDLGTLSID